MRQFGLTLRNKLILSCLLIALLPLLLLSAVNRSIMHKALAQNANQSLLAAANQTAISIDYFINANLDAIRVEAQLPGFAQYLSLPDEQRLGSDAETLVLKTFQALIRRDPLNVWSYSLLDRQGRALLDSNTTDMELDKSKRDYFQQPLQTGLPYVSPIQAPSATSARTSLYFSSPVRAADRTIAGVLAVRYNAAAIQQLVAQSSELAGPQSFAILLDEYHICLAHGALPHLVFRSLVPLPQTTVAALQSAHRLPPGTAANLATNLLSLERGLNQADTKPFFTMAMPEMGEQLQSAAVVKLRSQPWLVVFVQPQTVFLAPIQAQMHSALALAIAIALIVLALAVLMGRLLTLPLVALTRVVTRFTAGNLAVRAGVRTQDEIGILASSFNAMAEQVGRLLQGLADRTHELERSLDFEAMLKRITDKVRDSLDETQILQAAVQELGLVLDVRYCNATYYDEKPTVIRVMREFLGSQFSFQAPVLPSAEFPEIYQQLQTGQHLQFCTTLRSPAQAKFALLICPIFDGQGILGDLLLFDQPARSFNVLEIRLVQQVANQCAIAIRQARLYQQAQAQVSALETLNHLKDDFLSTVSHELRAPVTNMKMAIQMLTLTLDRQAATPLTPPTATAPSGASDKLNHYLQILDRECQREISLINDLLDLQRLDAGAHSLVAEPINLKIWLPSLVTAFQERAQSQQQSLELHLPDHLPEVRSDAASLKRILAELLHNACKYTPPGEKIVLDVCSSSDTVQFQITNFGTEIAASELSRIFEKFYRIPNADPWKRGGTGLGLALVKKLAENLGAALQVDSSQGQTCFTLELVCDRSGHS